MIWDIFKKKPNKGGNPNMAIPEKNVELIQKSHESRMRNTINKEAQQEMGAMKHLFQSIKELEELKGTLLQGEIQKIKALQDFGSDPEFEGEPDDTSSIDKMLVGLITQHMQNQQSPQDPPSPDPPDQNTVMEAQTELKFQKMTKILQLLGEWGLKNPKQAQKLAKDIGLSATDLQEF